MCRPWRLPARPAAPRYDDPFPTSTSRSNCTAARTSTLAARKNSVRQRFTVGIAVRGPANGEPMVRPERESSWRPVPEGGRGFPYPRDCAWCDDARLRMADLRGLAQKWATGKLFELSTPQPLPVLRAAPRD